MNIQLITAAAGTALLLGAPPASALNYTWATNVVTQGSGSASTADSNTARADPANALGAPDAVLGADPAGIFGLGVGEWADFTFGGQTFNGQTGVVFEGTNPPLNSHLESANVFAYLSTASAPSSNANTESSYVVSVPNTSAQNGFNFNISGTWDTIRLWDTSPSGNTSRGFDVDAVGVVPLPAAAWLLLGAAGALLGAKRRYNRRIA